ncbi:hypothetical protein LTR62_001788 [Meristemomyces frigidus]|uniref:N-acetyltransferase domain-containing protein n=1 Tax=Meristemomyces frigidus TaxID=1508187 RepID=A0AAN7TLK9_9PEZI|nr:hypothetical protein LTR62_001788 [Meristemomyces frigidus]
MPQSSLTTWLKKPAIITEPGPTNDNATNDNIAADSSAVNALNTSTPPDLLPCDHKGNVQTTVDATEKRSTPVARTSALPQPGRNLPPNVEIRACAPADLTALKRLNSVLLPIPYPDSFYREIIADPVTNNMTLLALWHDDPSKIGKAKGRLVGAIRCRLLPGTSITPGKPTSAPNSASGKTELLYLSSLALLSPYRGYGIASHLLRTLITRAVDVYGITSIGAHVWEANEEGLEWYRKRGFKVVEKELRYYRRLDPSTGVVVQRDVKVSDFLVG